MGLALRGLAMSCMLGLFCVLWAASPALAGSAHVFSRAFGGGTPGEGAGELNQPTAVAVNSSTHDVYVTDAGNHRVDEFTETGEFVLAFGANVGGFGVSICTLTCIGGSAGKAPGEFEVPKFIAVDNSGGPSAGDVYVADAGTSLVQKFDSSGNLLSSWGDTMPTPNGQLAASAVEKGPFISFSGVAVDASGNLWVSDTNFNFFEFEQAGAFIQSWQAPRFVEPVGIAVDSAQNLYFVRGLPIVEKVSSTGADMGEVAEDISPPTGLTSDPARGDLYVDEGSSIQRFSSSCDPSTGPCAVAETFGSPQLTGGTGLAVDPTNSTVYAVEPTANQIDSFTVALETNTLAASNVQATSAILNGTVDPKGSAVSDCHFEYGTTTSYGHTAPCAETVGAGTTNVSVHADVAELQGGTTYHFRLVATNAKGTARAQDETLPTLPVPVIDSASATTISASAADLNASIDTRGLATTYRFEWGASTAYGNSGPFPGEANEISAGASSAKTVSQHILRLESNTPYHWRVVAQNKNGATIGVDHTFVDDTMGPGLPDNRAYEMVTPPKKNGALFGNVVLGVPPDIAENGSRMIDTAIQCFGESRSCTAEREQEGEPFMFTRTPGGWVTSALAPSAKQFRTNSYWKSSANTGQALFTMPTAPAEEDDWYASEPDGSLLHLGPSTPPSTGAAGVGAFGGGARATTADFSHIVWQSLPVWPPRDESQAALYEYGGGENTAPTFVGVSGGPGSTDLISACGTSLGGSSSNLVNEGQALSKDGKVVFFTARGSCGSGTGSNASNPVPADELFARIDESRTVAISQRSATECQTPECEGSAPGDAKFEGASSDGSKVLFDSTQKLTDTASQDGNSLDSAKEQGCAKIRGSNGCNLYEYDFTQSAGHNLVAVSAGDSSGGGPRVRGVVAVSADGSHVYFVAKGVLTGRGNEQGQVAVDGANNLYLYERDSTYPGGRLAFVTALPDSDENLKEAGGHNTVSQWNVGPEAANVTPDGRFLVFGSHGTLTRDDTRSDGAQQIFRYDAQTGALVRISVGDSGFNDNGNSGFGDAAIVVPVPITVPERRDPTMSRDGSYVFFESPIGLTPGALNDVQIGTRTVGFEGEIGPVYAENVYEYHDGHVYLISDGRDTGQTGPASDVHLVGSDVSGANVFFGTSDQLVPQDTDTQMDYYDARICTESEPCIAPPPAVLPPCLGEACHGIPAATPSLLAPGSVTFSGTEPAPPEVKIVAKRKKKTSPIGRKHKKKPHARHGKRSKAKAKKTPNTSRSSRGGK